ncbi:MAG: hypothetical protein K1X83_05330 [Oligoflexia bacterium]|nr:hypothetical protein [Oligoflexia bacterium]
MNQQLEIVFEQFNNGELRGSDPVARQRLLDAFSEFPVQYLSSDGAFQSESTHAAGIDKFGSLLNRRAPKLKADGNRIVPGAMIRDGVHIGRHNIFMFHAAVNIAAYIGDDNMIDSHASVGSAAQIGNGNKIGSFVSLEGVLSPANAEPVIIGDHNFLGSFVRIGTGIVMGNHNFIGSGVNVSLGTKIRDCRAASSTRGGYVTFHDLNRKFDHAVLMLNNAVRTFEGVEVLPGEYLLFENSEGFMARFEADPRIKAAR